MGFGERAVCHNQKFIKLHKFINMQPLLIHSFNVDCKCFGNYCCLCRNECVPGVAV